MSGKGKPQKLTPEPIVLVTIYDDKFFFPTFSEPISVPVKLKRKTKTKPNIEHNKEKEDK